MKFPVRDFVISSVQTKCPKCEGDSELTPGNNFFKCRSCGTVTRGNNLQVNRVVKVTIDDQEITVFQPQLQSYCRKYSIDEKNEDDITEGFLKVDTTTMVVNRNGVCVCFE